VPRLRFVTILGTHRLLLVVVGGALPLGGGCAPSATGPSASAEPNPGRKVPPPSPKSIILKHDVGRVLSTGQELRHRFRLTNPTDQPLSLVNPTAFTPCCSSIGPVPNTLPPGGEVEVPVVFRTAGYQGRGRLGFSIEGDGSEPILWQMELTSDLVPDWEVATERVPRLAVGRAGEARLRIVCRRRDEVGLTPPDSVEGFGGLTAAFDGPTEEDAGEDGVVTSRRHVRIELPPAPEAGRRSGTVRFVWPDGSKRDHTIRWDVESVLTVEPKALFVTGSANAEDEIRRSVTVRSADRPIRLLEIPGPLAEKLTLPSDPSPAHEIDLVIDSSGLESGRAADIRIVTDHPDQPEIAVTVMRLSP